MPKRSTNLELLLQYIDSVEKNISEQTKKTYTQISNNLPWRFKCFLIKTYQININLVDNVVQYLNNLINILFRKYNLIIYNNAQTIN